MIRVRNSGLAAFFMLGVLSCSGGSTGPASGLLTLELHSPNGDDGAVMFTITGGPVDSIEAEGQSIYSASINSTTLRVVITGDLHSGTLARIRIRRSPGEARHARRAAAHHRESGDSRDRRVSRRKPRARWTSSCRCNTIDPSARESA